MDVYIAVDRGGDRGRDGGSVGRRGFSGDPGRGHDRGGAGADPGFADVDRRGGAAQNKQGWAAITTAVAVVLLNLCVLLPVVTLIWYPAQMIDAKDWIGSIHHLAMSGLGGSTPLPFSWVTWRVDNVVLVLLSFMLIPASLGRWKLGRTEGMTLIAVYAAYVLMEAAGSMRY